MNLTDVESINKNSIAAYVAIGLDLLVAIVSFILIWICTGTYLGSQTGMQVVYRKSKGKLGKMKFIITKIIIGFGFFSILDTIMGKGIYLKIISELNSEK